MNQHLILGGGCGSAPVGDKFCRPSQKSEKSPRTVDRTNDEKLRTTKKMKITNETNDEKINKINLTFACSAKKTLKLL